jgi:hypothetical protein
VPRSSLHLFLGSILGVGNLGELPSRGALDVCQTENESVIEIVWTTRLEPWPVVICKGVAAKPPLKMGPAMYVTTMARALTYGYGNSSESKSLNLLVIIRLLISVGLCVAFHWPALGAICLKGWDLEFLLLFHISGKPICRRKTRIYKVCEARAHYRDSRCRFWCRCH